MEGPLGDVVVPALKSTFMRTTTMSNHNYESRKATPWTGKENASDLEKFIDRCNHANYEKRHPCVKGCDEIAFLNSCIPVHCPHCGSDEFVRRGLTGTGLQRYMCKECHKTFTVITGTIFDQRKIPMTEWIDFLLSIMGYGSFHLTSRNNKNLATTTKYWLEKVFLLLRHRQEDIVLQGRVYLDETYIPVKGRDARRLPDGSLPRGLSRNRICITVACDDNNVVCIADGFGKPSRKRTLGAMSGHIEHGAVLVHDGDNSHNALIETLALESEVYTTAQTKELKDKDNPLQPVNRQHALLKRFLRAHSGFNRDEIQDYLNLYSFISSEPADKFEKINILLKLALSEPILLRFRALYGE